MQNNWILSNCDDNNLLKCFARCCVQRQYYCRPLSLVRMESWQIFYRPRHRGKQHLALRGVGATLRAGGQTRSFLNPLLMFFRSMVCLSHEPYYFSTRWITNLPNIPLFHHSNCERSELSSLINHSTSKLLNEVCIYS